MLASDLGLYYAVEFSQLEKASGDLARIGFKKKLPFVHVDAALEQRRYRVNFMRDFAYRLEQDYISVEDRDKQYTDPMNIFSDFETITTNTALLSFTVLPDKPLRFSSRNEFSRWQSPSLDQRPYAYDQKILFCPYPGRDTCVDVALTNIVSNASQPISIADRDNKPMIKLVKHWRLEAHILF